MVFQINLCHLLFRAALKVVLDSLILEWTSLLKNEHTFHSFNCKKKQKEVDVLKLIFKLLTATSGVPPGHILANLFINVLLDANAAMPAFVQSCSQSWARLTNLGMDNLSLKF